MNHIQETGPQNPKPKPKPLSKHKEPKPKPKPCQRPTNPNIYIILTLTINRRGFYCALTPFDTRIFGIKMLKFEQKLPFLSCTYEYEPGAGASLSFLFYYRSCILVL